MCPQGNCIYLFLILTAVCAFLHTHLSLEYVIFSPISSHGNNNWNIGSFFPTKYYLFCLNCPYFSSIANRLFSHLLCSFCAFLQNEKLWMNGCPCIFFCAVSISRNWGKTVINGLYIIAWFFPFSMCTDYITKEKVSFSSLLFRRQEWTWREDLVTLTQWRWLKRKIHKVLLCWEAKTCLFGYWSFFVVWVLGFFLFGGVWGFCLFLI